LNSVDGDILQFGEGISLANLSVQASTAADGSQIIDVSVAGASQIEIHTDASGGRVDEIDFADGTYVSLTDLLAGTGLSSNGAAALVGQAPHASNV
jgi:hypothetical protein